MLRLARLLISPMAAVIAFLVVIFDVVVHQLPIATIAKDTVAAEIFGYFMVFLVFYVAAWAVIKIELMHTPSGPILVGLFGATLFGIGLHAIQWDRTLNFVWAVIHFIIGATAASLVLRRFGKTLIVAVIIAVIVLAIVGFVV